MTTVQYSDHSTVQYSDHSGHNVQSPLTVISTYETSHLATLTSLPQTHVELMSHILANFISHVEIYLYAYISKVLIITSFRAVAQPETFSWVIPLIHLRLSVSSSLLQSVWRRYLMRL